ncbi:hypothetical protein H2201_000146 [Coniosporium apollinis]|uniref:t-SNARE coiled-coil homology domain-containing protein n=3 Tax=Coniosporium TaxID=2810619 RepID=A0ABQ9P723_9PEZI|nr:hypothetical protein H2201_000146 [Coniosporium apollinis]
MDITPVFNEILRKHGAPPVQRRPFRPEDLDSFLQEAYRINTHITELTNHLRAIRQPYLSAAHPPRRKHNTDSTLPHPNNHHDRKYLSDKDKNAIDANAKQLLRELHITLRNLSEAANLRESTASQVSSAKRARGGLGALGRWAAGGGLTRKSPEEEREEEARKTVKMHRESVIFYLQRKLEMAGEVQREMMDVRLSREVEKSKSVLARARGFVVPEDVAPDGSLGGGYGGQSRQGFRGAGSKRSAEDVERRGVDQTLDPEQLQLFAEENQTMLKHYEDTLDQVRSAERSLYEISELQNTLAVNLDTQAAQIDQLVQDSFSTAENVGSGNKELKRASERKSTARMVFYGTCAFCFTLVVWDLLI